MESISLREFQLHASKYIKELPIVLTKYGKPIAKVIPFVLTDSPPIENKLKEKEVEEIRESFKVCQHGARLGLCKHGCTRVVVK